MKTILYLGTDPAHFEAQKDPLDCLIHYPVIKIIPRSSRHPEIQRAYGDLNRYTHLLFTSKNAVQIFFELLKTSEQLTSKIVIAIGEITAKYLSARRLPPQFVSSQETQEGVVELLKGMNLEGAYFFMPRSSRSRLVLTNFFKERGILCLACDFYDTVEQELAPRPDLTSVDEIIFTSPSTVEGFLKIYGTLPQTKKLLAIGQITRQSLSEQLLKQKNDA